MKRSTLMTLSIVGHLAVGAGLGAIQVKEAFLPTAIEIADVKEPPKPKQDQQKPKTPPPPPKATPNRQYRQAPAADAPPAAADPNGGFSDLPDFGLALAGGVGMAGIAVPAPRALDFKPAETKVKELAPAPKPRSASCSAAASKPKPLSVPRPEYPASARSSGVEGKVRLELTVGPAGEVVSVRVLQSLGEDTDAVASAAARRARFAPALACGKPTTGTFTVAMRFVAG